MNGKDGSPIWKVATESSTRRHQQCSEEIEGWENMDDALKARIVEDSKEMRSEDFPRNGSEVSSSERDETILKQLLEGIDPKWDQQGLAVKEDLFHWSELWCAMSGADKRSPLFKAFQASTSDAVSVLLQGEKVRLTTHARKKLLTPEFTGQKL